MKGGNIGKYNTKRKRAEEDAALAASAVADERKTKSCSCGYADLCKEIQSFCKYHIILNERVG
jgi:hypothetical protein